MPSLTKPVLNILLIPNDLLFLASLLPPMLFAGASLNMVNSWFYLLTLHFLFTSLAPSSPMSTGSTVSNQHLSYYYYYFILLVILCITSNTMYYISSMHAFQKKQLILKESNKKLLIMTANSCCTLNFSKKPD